MRFSPLALIAKVLKALVPEPIGYGEFFDDRFWDHVGCPCNPAEGKASQPPRADAPADPGG